MSPVLASELSETPVMSTDGRRIGQLDMLTLDPETGDLSTVIVDTDHSELFGIQEREDSRIHLPASVLRDVRDKLIIEPPEQDHSQRL